MERIDIGGGLQLVDLALLAPLQHTLIIADPHVGFEDALHRDGTLVPRGHLDAIARRLDEIASALELSPESPLQRVIINGDLRHQFGPLTLGEYQGSRALLGKLLQIGREVVILEGNHDGNLAHLVEDDERVTLRRSYRLDELFFLHGDEEPEALPPGVHTIVIGHEHPAVGLRDRVTGRMELFKCFLVGGWRGARLVVQPTFNPWTAGSNLVREQHLSPLLDGAALEDFDVYVVSDERAIYPFGPLKQLMTTTG